MGKDTKLDLRQMAEFWRLVAADMGPSVTADKLLQVADEWDEMADTVEEREHDVAE